MKKLKSLHKQALKNKRLIIMILLVLAVTITVLVAVISTMRVSFNKNYTDHANQLNQTLLSASNKFEELADTQKTADYITALDNLESYLKGSADNAPSAPKLGAVYIAGDEDKREVADYKKAITELAAEVDASKRMLNYQVAIGKELKALMSTGAVKASAQKELAKKWRAAATKINDLEHPSALNSVHDKLVKCLNDSAKIIEAMAGLYSKKDVAGFAVKQNELNAKINTMHGYKKDFVTAANLQDQHLAQKLAALRFIINNK